MSSIASGSGQKFPRRTSVIPGAVSFTRQNTENNHGSGGGGGGGSANRSSFTGTSQSGHFVERKSIVGDGITGFNATDRLRRMSTLFGGGDKSRSTKEVIMAALEDPARTEYKRLKYLNERLLAEWKRLRKFIEQLALDYEATRRLDPIRRYKQLQAMTKRTVMHLRLTDVGSACVDSASGEVPIHGTVVQSEAKEREVEKRIIQMCDNYTVEELGIENRRLRDQNERSESRIQLIVHSINQLDLHYRVSKQDNLSKRYTSLRDAIKQVLNDPELTEAP